MEEAASSPACPNCAKLQKRVAELEGQLAKLQAKLAELERKLNRNSSNSSQPPSADPPWNKQAPAKPLSGRRPGGQPGHEGHQRERLPAERVTSVRRFIPKTCAHCHAPLPEEAGPQDPPEQWHQVVELPVAPAEVTEYQGHARTCPACGKVTRAEIPAALRAASLGPNLATTLAYLTGRGHCSKRCAQEILETVFEVPVGLGTVSRVEQEMTAALAAPHQEALEAVCRAPVKNVDETGWFKRGKLCWLWVAATLNVAVFKIQAGRGKDGLKAFLGAVAGIVGSDRWAAYASLLLSARQLCWAHLKRDFQRLAELGAGTRSSGRAGLRAVKAVFALWRDFKDRRIDRPELQRRLAPVRARLQRALRRGAQGPDKTAKRFCRRILKVYEALWTFAAVPGVEPTNNHAERMLRSAVLWRKGSFGNHSEAGCRFSERILTVVQTLRLQNRPVLAYLRAALAAHRAGMPAPALLAA